MNSCRYCKFVRDGFEECVCLSLNKEFLQEGATLFQVPQQIDFSCKYCNPYPMYKDFFDYDYIGNLYIKETNYVWDGVWK